ncbi:MAG: hypothetical protein Q8O56_00855 [Solirubrobacteraceae bacterium]|nr:hypothetical protein [Solirubrobacteraceae bacterium]
MSSPAARRRRLAAGAMLLASCVLAACGADDEPPTRAGETTATGARVGAVAVSTTPAAASTTPGRATRVGTANRDTRDQSCANPLGQRAGSAALTGEDPAALAAASATQDLSDPSTTFADPASSTTTPIDPATPVDPTTPADQITTPVDPTTSTDPSGTSTPTSSDDNAPLPADQTALPRPFSSGSPWNTPIDARPVDPRSANWIRLASRRVAVVSAADRSSVATVEREAPDLRLYVNTCAWTPAVVGAEGRTVRTVCRQRNCGNVARDLETLRIPDGVDPFPEYDGWYSVIDESTGVGYDMWRARRVGDVLSYQFIKRWLLDGPGFSPPAVSGVPGSAVGARGSGLPLFAGVIQPNELRQGRIEHALAISVPGPAQRIFVQPASVTNGINVINSLPDGARLRLKSSYRPRPLPEGVNRRSAEAIITALRTYGAIVVDRSITPTLYARRSTDYGTLLLGNELQGIRLDDLEVVQAGPLLRFPPLESTSEVSGG